MFRSLHPSDSSGGGLHVPQARHRYRGDRAEDPMRCMFCGFINDMTITPSGDAYDGVGMSYGALTTTTFNYPTPAGAKQLTMTIKTIQPTRVSGCALCGTMNEEGHLMGSSFGRNEDLSNQ